MDRRQFIRCTAVAAVPAALAGCGASMPTVSRQPRPEDALLDAFGVDGRGLARVLETLGRNGADFGEVFFQHHRERQLRAVDGQLLSAKNGSIQGAGLRVVRNGESGFAVAESLDEATLRAAAGTASDSLSAGEARAASAAVITTTPDRYGVERPWSEVLVRRRYDIVDQLDTLVRQADSAVTATEILLTDVDDEVLIARLDGRIVADRRPMTRLSVQVSIREAGTTHTGFASLSGRHGDSYFTQERLGSLAGDAVRRTRQLFEARTPPAGELPVVLAAGASGVVIHETLGHALEADLVVNGSSRYRDAIGDAIASAELTVIDDPTLPGERGSLNVDDEGEPAERRVLVEAGTLRSFVQDRASAAALGSTVAGNGRRESYRHAPIPRMSNTYIDNGSHEPDELLDAMDRGIIAETYTGGGVDTRTGRFRFRVRNGWYVENGQRRVPVRDFEISGTGPELLQGVSMVANDRRMDAAGWTRGKNGQTVPVSHGMPSVLVDSLGVRPLS